MPNKFLVRTNKLLAKQNEADLSPVLVLKDSFNTSTTFFPHNFKLHELDSLTSYPVKAFFSFDVSFFKKSFFSFFRDVFKNDFFLEKGVCSSYILSSRALRPILQQEGKDINIFDGRGFLVVEFTNLKKLHEFLAFYKAKKVPHFLLDDKFNKDKWVHFVSETTFVYGAFNNLFFSSNSSFMKSILSFYSSSVRMSLSNDLSRAYSKPFSQLFFLLSLQFQLQTLQRFKLLSLSPLLNVRFLSN